MELYRRRRTDFAAQARLEACHVDSRRSGTSRDRSEEASIHLNEHVGAVSLGRAFWKHEERNRLKHQITAGCNDNNEWINLVL